MPDTIIPTKLFKPLTRPALVPRSRLFNQLNNGLHRTLTLISAPAGFGKNHPGRRLDLQYGLGSTNPGNSSGGLVIP